MKHIFRNLIPYWKSIIAIILLLMVQAYCDLSLPQYTSAVSYTHLSHGHVDADFPRFHYCRISAGLSACRAPADILSPCRRRRGVCRNSHFGQIHALPSLPLYAQSLRRFTYGVPVLRKRAIKRDSSSNSYKSPEAGCFSMQSASIIYHTVLLRPVRRKQKTE